MKNLDLNAYGVQEMKQQEIEDINGGIPFLGGIWIGYAFGECMNNPGEVWEGIKNCFR